MQISPYFNQVAGQIVSLKVSQSGWVDLQETEAGVLYVPTLSSNLFAEPAHCGGWIRVVHYQLHDRFAN